MRNVTVYRVDYVRKMKVPIGTVVECRVKDRGNNIIGLLRLARKAFSTSAEEAFHIAVDSSGASAS